MKFAIGLTGELAGDLKPYTTLSYANGPGFTSAFSQGNRVDLTGVDTSNQKNIKDSKSVLS